MGGGKIYPVIDIVLLVDLEENDLADYKLALLAY